MKQLKILFFILAVCLIGMNTCDLPTDPGPMPKDLIDTRFEPGLNIFGVLRADSVSGSSFIHVEKALLTEEMYSESDIFDSTVIVQVTDTLTGETFDFNAIEDTTHRGYYYNDEFYPEPGHYYTIEIQSDSLPTLTAGTTVPMQPQITSSTLSIETNKVCFDLQLTADTYQYNFYLFVGEDIIEKQIANDKSGTTTVSIDFPESAGSPTGLVIIGYDRNLTEYLNSSPAFIPQTFHEMVNTVKNGYGCFGSLAVMTIGL